ncbi:GGDEF domain-containing protein [Pseudomonas sp. MT3]|uniref:sensor domain-containing diguanylate cyclase n=1 Tax=Pseudomonas sp. ATCC 13867 TaxID=1294143 RepID=UPI0002C4EF1A|nr:sensor domain-containing diguanylate cyclase [Pseudomonas sp. ATCC 13867]AGI26575.1 cyclic di-GMP signal transduction protein [Pseudomonas sp. ATCC 13867]RFQ33584.1 sensor domain-containing diguanylate cyclase [Pseudomonas sp. ATCC 13867]
MGELDVDPGTDSHDNTLTLRLALDIVSDGIWDWHIRSNHVSRSPGWYAMLGYDADSLPENVATWHEVIHPEDFEQVMNGFNAYVEGRSQQYAEEYRCRCLDGSYLWVSDHGRFVEYDETGRATRMIGAHRNIHERKLAELALQQKNLELQALNQQLEALVDARTEALRRANQALAEQAAIALRLSEIDPLTQIANRRRFEQQLHAEWQRLQRHGHACAVMMFDLDHFKRINDSLGHPAGDRVLVAVAEVVRRRLREEDCFARWGGEEFIVLLPETACEEARELAERLRLSLRRADISLPVQLTASFAVTAMRPAEDLMGLMRRLDDGLYRAKQQRDCIVAC